MQDDVLHAEFTVYETIWYAAYLRLGSAWDNKTREERINKLLELLEIDHRRNVIVGDTRSKGISGGERKRLALAVELLTKPKLLFLDEVLSKLDLYLINEITNFQTCNARIPHEPQPTTGKWYHLQSF